MPSWNTNSALWGWSCDVTVRTPVCRLQVHTRWKCFLFYFTEVIFIPLYKNTIHQDKRASLQNEFVPRTQKCYIFQLVYIYLHDFHCKYMEVAYGITRIKAHPSHWCKLLCYLVWNQSYVNVRQKSVLLIYFLSNFEPEFSCYSALGGNVVFTCQITLITSPPISEEDSHMCNWICFESCPMVKVNRSDMHWPQGTKLTSGH